MENQNPNICQPGVYQAKILDYGIGQTKNGDPQMMILFGFQESETKKREMIWFGSFKEGKAREITLKALLTCGFSGDRVGDLANGHKSGLLNQENYLSITIEHEMTQDGKTVPKIRWINSNGSQAFQNRLSHQEAQSKISSLGNLKGELMALRANAGAPKASSGSANYRNNSPAPAPSTGGNFWENPPAFAEEDLPF